MHGCTGCAHDGPVITIRMRIAGHDVTFHRCGRCESNTWEEDGGVLSLDEVLELARAGR
ncbi:MAG: hypothetical protein ACT4OX_09315 [Actinomycetota bacterium]